jgi:hypothetical protein
MSGKGRSPAYGGCVRTPDVDVCWDPIVIEDGEDEGRYLYFWFDTSSEMAADISNWDGRIHGVQMEFFNVQTAAGRGAAEFEWVGFFRSVEEGQAFVKSYLGVEDTTDEPTDDTTEQKPADTTEQKPADTTEKKPENTTEKKPATTEAPSQSGSCKSMLGAGAVAVVALVAACGAVVLRKKED